MEEEEEEVEDEEYEILDECTEEEDESPNNSSKADDNNDDDVSIIDIKIDFIPIEQSYPKVPDKPASAEGSRWIYVKGSNLSKWYEDKIISKKVIVKERLSQISKIIANYPCYKIWLEKLTKYYGVNICPLLLTRKCPLDKMTVNRWRFICTKKTEEMKDFQGNNSHLNGSDLKTIVTMWQMNEEKTGHNKSFGKLPLSVLCAVKVFEDFINSDDQFQLNNDVWLRLIIRSNSDNELMLFVTGADVSDSLLEKLRNQFENGVGKYCNVKSLYCKSISKTNNDKIITLLSGEETLDEKIGNLKVKLYPRTNFWLNTAGAELLIKAVEEFLDPQHNTTVVDVGCGIGLIGLTMADKCQQVIGFDMPSEIEEANITCQLNEIKNATFLTGDVPEALAQISNSLKGCRGAAILNLNTTLGRMTEVIKGLRKIPSLEVVILITTLAKQSIQPILELTRPESQELGKPFIPSQAVIVDTLPTGPTFEVVIRLERNDVDKFFRGFLTKCRNFNIQVGNLPNYVKNPLSKQVQSKQIESSNLNLEYKDNSIGEIVELVKNPFHEKERTQKQLKRKVTFEEKKNPEDGKIMKLSKLKQSNSEKVSQNCLLSNNNRIENDLYQEKNSEDDKIMKLPEFKQPNSEKVSQNILKNRLLLNNNRIENDLYHKLKEQQKFLEEAQTKLNSLNNNLETTGQIKNLLNLAIDKTNEIQNHLSRSSVWDRIDKPSQELIELDDLPTESLMKGRSVKEVGRQEFIITTLNNNFVENEDRDPTINTTLSTEPSLDNYVEHEPNDFQNSNVNKRNNKKKSYRRRHLRRQLQSSANRKKSRFKNNSKHSRERRSRSPAPLTRREIRNNNGDLIPSPPENNLPLSPEIADPSTIEPIGNNSNDEIQKSTIEVWQPVYYNQFYNYGNQPSQFDNSFNSMRGNGLPIPWDNYNTLRRNSETIGINLRPDRFQIDRINWSPTDDVSPNSTNYDLLQSTNNNNFNNTPYWNIFPRR